MNDSPPKIKVIVWDGDKKTEEEREVVSYEKDFYFRALPIPKLNENEIMAKDFDGTIHVIKGGKPVIDVEIGLDGVKAHFKPGGFDIELMMDLAMSKPEWYGDVFKKEDSDKSGPEDLPKYPDPE
jgi:hypothetical protein